MTALACFLLLAASTSVELVDEVYQIPSARWNYIPINLRQNPARIDASFQVDSGPGRVRLALLTQADLERLREELPHGLLAVTDTGNSGALRFRVRQPGDYALVVDNRSGKGRPAAVHLRIALDFAPAPPAVTRLDPRRQLTVIVLAFAFFVGVVTFSARKLLRAAKRP
ncbi:MAG: hypothetical protein NTW28_20385 [Candidatus Solibacter sp.]|nr:hypothetical protein [Candidatus Solibacter sp.]